MFNFYSGLKPSKICIYVHIWQAGDIFSHLPHSGVDRQDLAVRLCRSTD
jgi:hypothetical protein